MVKFILGSQGSGKTKWLVGKANDEMEKGNGNIVFIDVDDNHIFNLNYSVRLINALEFKILSIESLYGFLCGIISRDYDVEKIYVDGIYKIMELDIEALQKITNDLNPIGERFGVTFYIGADFKKEELPTELRQACVEIETE